MSANNILVVIALIAAGSDCDSLGSLLWPPLIALGTHLRILASCLEGHPSTTIGGRLPIVLDENGSNRLLARGVPGGDVGQLLHGLWLITDELLHWGSAVHSVPEC
jgi:hypothetical protein